MVQQPSCWRIFTRRKVLAAEGAESDGKLNRILGLYDLTALGVGSTLGAGVYVLAGQIARDQAGPSVIISFVIAALASLLAGICYAEFGARVPKAGSAYIYSYVCIGEFVAFVIGWNLMLEYIIGTASVCRGISLYLDTLINDTLKQTFAEVAPMNVGFLGSYFDFFAFGLVIVFGVALAFGVETSTIANNFCTCLNICILLFVIIAGSIKANFANWSIDVSTVNATDTNLGQGGFFPFGFTGTLKGAATCFFGFVGFDCIATTGEEVRNPRKNIPRSILLSLLIIFLCYFGVSTVLTLMVPYYQQDPNAPLPYAFKVVGWPFAMWIVALGGLIGLLASLFGALFPLPRVMYSMAQDGLLFRFLGKVSPRFRVPVVGSIFAAMMTALIAGLFDLDQLVSLLSIGTLLAYSVVAISVTILRYMDNEEEIVRDNGTQPPTENTLLTSSGMRVTCGSVMTQLFNCRRLQTPNTLSTRIVGTLITIFCLLSLGIGLIFTRAYDALIHNQIWVLALLGVLVGLTFFVLLAICLQPREAYIRLFRVPFVPIIPAVSIFINIYLMLQLDSMTWIRFGLWMIIGWPIFIMCWCMYDIKNPAKRNPERVAFMKMLRETSMQNGKCINGNLNVNGKNNIKNGSVLSTKSHSSLKSLDEIKNINECCDELIECKHPNGKVFYVEESKSSNNTSQASLEQNEAQSKSNSSEEEENTAIAMLDDVLQGEDDGVISPLTYAANLHNSPHQYNRKISVDSEMLPSVIETTIVATVHSSDSSDYTDLDETAEIEHELNCQRSTEYMAKKAVAQELVDELLTSADLWNSFQQRKSLRELELSLQTIITQQSMSKNTPDNSPEHNSPHDSALNSPQTSTINSPYNSSFDSAPLNSPLNGSIRSKTSDEEDALHSEKFKQRLSQLIMQPPIVISSSTKIKNVKSDEENLTLKQSKSENDLRPLVLAAVKAIDTVLNSNENHVNQSNTTIPRPPKFDPLLYNTINSLKFTRARPSLDKLLEKDKERKSPISEKIADTEGTNEPEVPFKLKLEALLKRGPSHYSQKRPPDVDTRPKSIELVLTADANEVGCSDKLEVKAENVTAKLENNLTDLNLNADQFKDSHENSRNSFKALQRAPTTNPS